MRRIAIFAMILCMLGCLLLSGCGTQPAKIEYESPEQEAVIVTALSYLARGTRIQYDDSRIATGNIVPTNLRYRWQSGLKTPEDYTSQFTGYTNCAGFTYDVYHSALDYDILSNTTASLIQKGGDEMVFKYFPKGSETAEEQAEIEERFRSTLKMGDIIVVRYNGSRKGNGHAMLYVGEEVPKGVTAFRGNTIEGVETTTTTTAADSKKVRYDIIHSTGSSYNYGNFTERYEQVGSIQLTSTDYIFDPDSSRYIFGKLESIGIVRPLAIYKGGVPEQTQNRINNLQGVIAEKLSSHTYGMTADRGDEVTFTFSITNTNKKAVTVEVADTVPSNTTYISGAETVTDNTLSWNVKVPAGKTETVSYAVKVNADAVYGETVASTDGLVGGVSTNCPVIYIANTLNKDESQKILSAMEKLKTSELRGFELANAVYNEALGTTELLPDTYDDVLTSLFENYLDVPTHFTPRLNDKYTAMLAPALYGGRYVITNEELFGGHRSRLPYQRDLMVGDILIIAEDGGATTQRMYLFAGDTMYDLLNETEITTESSAERLNKLLAYNRFAVLRPSMAIK